jgi:hypothetical protein
MSGSNYGLFWLAVIWGSLVGALALAAFIQERPARRIAVISGWFGVACLCAVAIGSLTLLAVGVM